jgi:hypothetical protein
MIKEKIIEKFSLWRSLRVLAITILVTVLFQMASETYDIIVRVNFITNNQQAASANQALEFPSPKDRY